MDLVPVTNDIHTALITVKNPDDSVSLPEVFVVTATSVTEVQSGVAGAGTSSGVSVAPVAYGGAGVSAWVSNIGGDPVVLTVANYSSNPTSTPKLTELSGTVFAVGVPPPLTVNGFPRAHRRSR